MYLEFNRNAVRYNKMMAVLTPDISFNTTIPNSHIHQAASNTKKVHSLATGSA